MDKNFKIITMKTNTIDNNTYKSKIKEDSTADKISSLKEALEYAQNERNTQDDVYMARKNSEIPTTKGSMPLGVFKKSHTCGSLFAKCSCYNDKAEGRSPLLQTFSHPTAENYIIHKKSSNPLHYSTVSATKPTTKRLSNPELTHKQETGPRKSSSRSTQNLYLCHPEIPYPIPIPRKHLQPNYLGDKNNALSKSVPKHFESSCREVDENSQYISNYTENFHFSSNKIGQSNIEYHKYNAIAYQEQLEDPAQKFFKESGIFGPMGNGVGAIRKNSGISAEVDVEQIRKVSKTMCVDNLKKNSAVLVADDDEYLKTIISNLKKELSDNEIKVGTLEKDLIQAKKVLRAKESEVLKLQREVHKLKVSENTYLHMSMYEHEHISTYN